MNAKAFVIATIILPGASMAAGSIIPCPPSGMSAKADATGLLKAIVNFRAPEEATDGTTLASLDRVELKRDGKLIRTFDNIAPGEDCEYTDAAATNGYTSYSAIAYYEDTGSEEAKSSVIFIGVDEPLPPKQLKAALEGNKISFTWPKSEKKGKNGERVRQDGLTYLLDLLDDSYEYRQQLTETKGQTHDYFCEVNAGTQDIRRFGIRAYNTTGYSDYTYARVIVGAPYYFPYRESFAGGTARGLIWQEGDGTFSLVTDFSSDEDYGAVRCTPSPDGSATSFNLGKMSMANTLNPRMSFRMAGLPEGEKLLVKVTRYDGAEATLLAIEGPVDDWTLFTVDMTPMRNESFLIPKFLLAEGNEETVYIDDICFEDPYTYDLAVRVITPEEGAGRTEISVELENVGLESADNAEIRIYADGKTAGNINLQEKLHPGEIKMFNHTIEISGTESVEIKATLDWMFDLNPVNNVSTAQIIPVGTENNSSTSGITDIREAIKSGATVYTVDGRKIQADNGCTLSPGVYIVNGKKIIVK